MQQAWKIIRKVAYLLLGSLLILYIFTELFFPNETIKLFKLKPLIVLTNSMEPHINRNDIVFIQSIDVDNLKEKDIIAFKVDINHDGKKETVTHYIYSIKEIKNGNYEIKTNRFYKNELEKKPDPWMITEHDLIGKYIWKVPYIGEILLFLKSPIGLVVSFINLGIILVIIKVMKQGKKKKNNK